MEKLFTHDAGRLLEMAHEMHDKTRLDQWKHSKKWEKYCKICKAKEELLSQKISLSARN